MQEGLVAALDSADLLQLRLIMEELCCDLCRFEHMAHGAAPESVRIDREVYLGVPDQFADVRVRAPGRSPYIVEVKLGYPDDVLVRHLCRKYGGDSAAGADSIILVVDTIGRTDWPATLAKVRGSLRPGLRLDVWDEPILVKRIHECFGVDVRSFKAPDLMQARMAIDHAKGRYAFNRVDADYEHSPLHAQLLWHFAYWRVRQLQETRGADARRMLPPGEYRNVAVVLADLCSFSSYMRDTNDPRLVRDSLTAFYSRARYQIINNGGMLYQFVGDEVIGLFGIPDAGPDVASVALDTARQLLSIGASVAQHWQRHLDRVQPSAGLHIGIAVGDLQIVSLRPFSRTHIGALGDCINLAARLMARAGQGEIVATNSFHRQLNDEEQRSFVRAEPVELRNVGKIQAWKLPAG